MRLEARLARLAAYLERGPCATCQGRVQLACLHLGRDGEAEGTIPPPCAECGALPQVLVLEEVPPRGDDV